MKLKGSLGYSVHEMVEFEILTAARRMHSKLSALDFRRADFGFFRNLLSKILWNKTLSSRGAKQSRLIFKDDLQAQDPFIPTKKRLSKSASRPAWIN